MLEFRLSYTVSTSFSLVVFFFYVLICVCLKEDNNCDDECCLGAVSLVLGLPALPAGAASHVFSPPPLSPSNFCGRVMTLTQTQEGERERESQMLKYGLPPRPAVQSGKGTLNEVSSSSFPLRGGGGGGGKIG